MYVECLKYIGFVSVSDVLISKAFVKEVECTFDSTTGA